MAPLRADNTHRRQSLKPKPSDDQVRPFKLQPKKSLTPIRKSARLQEKQLLPRQQGSLKQGYQILSFTSDIPFEEPTKDLSSLRPSNPNRKRKRTQLEEFVHQHDHKQKQQTNSSITSTAKSCSSSEFLTGINPIEYWRRQYTWPKSYFEQDFDMSQPLTRKRSSSVRSQVLQSNQDTGTDLPREAKSAPYKDARYETYLAAAGGFMDESDIDVCDDSKALCERLLSTTQDLPSHTLFRDDLFKGICRKIRNESEAMIIQDITRLIVPSAENLAIYGAVHLKILKEKINASWLKCLPLTKPRPQPDYSVGFKTSAFTEDQLNRLSPFVGGYKDQCSVMAREDMYFPFLTCEVKCGDQALNIADRQNMHSASVSVKGIVELFRRFQRQKKLHRIILAFSISHDNEMVRIYDHYPLIDGDDASVYRYPLRKFDITSEEGKEKWTAYKFTRNVYDIFVPAHLKRIYSVVNQLPDPGVFNVQSSFSFVSNPRRDEEDGNGTAPSSSQDTDVIANTAVSSQTTPPTFKKPRGKGFR